MVSLEKVPKCAQLCGTIKAAQTRLFDLSKIKGTSEVSTKNPQHFLFLELPHFNLFCSETYRISFGRTEGKRQGPRTVHN